MSRLNFFPAKLFLFGEYTTLNGSSSLAIPVEKFYGEWKEGIHEAYPFDLDAWLSYITEYDLLKDQIDTSSIEEEYRHGIRFVANIPIGGGLGSSGALTAAVYSRYRRKKLDVINHLDEIKNILANLESFFHGESSGVDPLVSYSRMAYYKYANSGNLLDSFTLPEGIEISLIPTSKNRDTGQLVRMYRSHLEDHDFYNAVVNDLIPIVGNCIQTFILADGPAFHEQLMKLSQNQWDYFQPMIIDDVRDLWQHGLNTGDFGIKLCGAGGGGYYLGFGDVPDIAGKINISKPPIKKGT